MNKPLVQLAFAMAFTIASMPMVAACSGDHKIGGRTANVVFSDTKLADLAKAACRGDRSAVERIVLNGVNPNGEGMDGFTALGWAVSCQNVAGVEALLKAGSDPNKMMGGSYSAVIMATNYPNTGVLKMLLQHGGNPNATDSTGRSALVNAVFFASDSGKLGNYHALLNAGADINLVGPGGGTVAQIAALSDRWDLVEDLLTRGYRHDLENLGLLAQANYGERNDDPHRRKVIEMLKERGVIFPVKP